MSLMRLALSFPANWLSLLLISSKVFQLNAPCAEVKYAARLYLCPWRWQLRKGRPTLGATVGGIWESPFSKNHMR